MVPTPSAALAIRSEGTTTLHVSFALEKPLWTDDDFEQMGWHDVPIHAIAFRPELFELWLDVDYIFRWEHPTGEASHFHFWIAPSTLVFHNVYNVKFDIESLDGNLSLQRIARSQPGLARNAQFLEKQTEHSWQLECREGEIAFRSSGYSQFTRRPPVLTANQKLTLEERGKISFDTDFIHRLA